MPNGALNRSQPAQRKKGGEERGRRSPLPGAIAAPANVLPFCLLGVIQLLIHKQLRVQPEPTYPQNGQEGVATLPMFSKKGWGGRIPQENIPHCCLSPSSLKITLSPLSVLQGAFDFNIGISRLSSGIAEAAHGTNRVNKTDRQITHTHTHLPR